MPRIAFDFSFDLDDIARQKDFLRCFKCDIKSRQNKFIHSQFRKSYTFIPRVYRYGMAAITSDPVQHKFSCNRTEFICLQFLFSQYIERNILEPYRDLFAFRHHLHSSVRQTLIQHSLEFHSLSRSKCRTVKHYCRTNSRTHLYIKTLFRRKIHILTSSDRSILSYSTADKIVARRILRQA